MIVRGRQRNLSPKPKPAPVIDVMSRRLPPDCEVYEAPPWLDPAVLFVVRDGDHIHAVERTAERDRARHCRPAAMLAGWRRLPDGEAEDALSGRGPVPVDLRETGRFWR